MANITTTIEPTTIETTTFETTSIYYGLEQSEMLNIVLLSEALLVSAIFFTIAIFYYSKTSQQKALQFGFCYKILAILIVFLSFFLMASALTSAKDITHLHIGITIVCILLLIIIIITNTIGMMDYRYICWNTCLDRMDGLHENKCCQKVLYFIIALLSFLLIIISFNKNAAVHTETILIIAFFITILCTICNRVSVLIAITMFCTLILGFLVSSPDAPAHMSKFLIYGFPIILIVFLLHALLCCRNTKQNKQYFRKHVGYNIFCALLGIINRATNVVVLLICASLGNKGGFIAIIQLFFIVFTAIISTISVTTNVDNASNNGNVVLHDDENDVRGLKKYFCLGKVFTFFGWGRIWFEMATWDRNKQRDDVIIGYHMIKIHELMFECFTSLSLQIIVIITVFVHETVSISIFVCVVYITLTVIGIIYDEITAVDEVIVARNEIELATTAHTNGTVHAQSGGETVINDRSVVRSQSHLSVAASVQSVEQENVVSWKVYCSILSSVVFIWSDYLMRIVPLWILSKASPLLCALYVIILFVVNNILYWRMIAKTDGFKCSDVVLFGWTGIISGSFYYVSTMKSKYIAMVVNERVLCMEYWIRLVLSLFVVFIAMEQATFLLGALFVFGVIFNIACGYRIYFNCCCKQQNVVAQQAMPEV